MFAARKQGVWEHLSSYLLTPPENSVFGPLESLVNDPTVSDILVNRFDRIYVERGGGVLMASDVAFRDNRHLLQVIEGIATKTGQRVDESCPLLDARLLGDITVKAIIPPLAIDGPCLAIRKFYPRRLTAEQLIANETLTPPMLELLSAMVKNRINIVVSGTRGTGKTTLLNILCGFIPNHERIVTIEDDGNELPLKQDHVARLVTRPPNIDGKGAIRQRELVINSLRMRPDRIVVGEVDGGEVFDLLQFNTNHEGSMTTVNAGSQGEAVARLAHMVGMAIPEIPESAQRYVVAAGVDAVVHVARLSDGTRKVMAISEVTGVTNERISTRDIFVYEPTGLSPEGRVCGSFHATGSASARFHGVQM
jgi:pilus assembly protein CpaF